jgi:hypothetical protein
MRSEPPPRPTFFLIGAPKCGTTSLAEYLRGHPRICFSDPKEPHYFATDRPYLRHFLTEEEYLRRAFSHCSGRHLAVGEGSTHYMLSRVAVPEILRFAPAAKLIAMVRNPIELVQSLHHENLYNLIEDEPDFEKAWRLQPARLEGQRISRRCRIPELLQYREAGMLGAHIQRVLCFSSPDQLLVVVFDDLVQDAAEVYRSVLAFLGLEHDGRAEFPVANVRRIQSAWFRRVAGAVPLSFWDGLVRFRRTLELREFGIRRRLGEATSNRVAPVPLRPEFRAELVRAFREDVERLSSLLHRDLSHWLATPADEYVSPQGRS